ncbi:DUF4245 domain-containing protein [Conyzicola nivalis]|uniref:DUF4245 domain-containing protein n=1 Tax=Conyzicola nivalis TaxID=1477021 RepID=A0A916STC2_9MICO|nr:DUF4245 domain-containing protein [Conyzicola nivalis]GGB15322.1 hypothetical protein GCM10010979_32420 [Conyzicola nivalis]
MAEKKPPRDRKATGAVTTRVPQQKPAPIVAELGRPETPEETAARKAENSRKHRANQTLRNLVWSLVASVGLMLLIVIVVVRPDQPAREAVDFADVAEQAQPTIDEPLAVPDVPAQWTANNADLGQSRDGVSTWNIGFITPSTQFIALNQGIDANPTWLLTLLDQQLATGTDTVDGREWTVYDNRDGDDPGNLAYAMVTESGDSTYVLYGTADTNEFRTLAGSVGTEIDAAEAMEAE